MQEIWRTVKYSVDDDVKFEKIALKLGRSKRQVFSQMVDYFYRSKKDPLDLNDELLKNTILKGQREYISFIKAQESDLIIPIRRDQTRTLEMLKRIIDCLNDQLLKQHVTILENQVALAKRMSVSNDGISRIQMRLDTREGLKDKFVYILENYIRARDAFNMMTGGNEKAELKADTIRQINQL